MFYEEVAKYARNNTVCVTYRLYLICDFPTIFFMNIFNSLRSWSEGIYQELGDNSSTDSPSSAKATARCNAEPAGTFTPVNRHFWGLSLTTKESVDFLKSYTTSTLSPVYNWTFWSSQKSFTWLPPCDRSPACTITETLTHTRTWHYACVSLVPTPAQPVTACAYLPSESYTHPFGPLPMYP